MANILWIIITLLLPISAFLCLLLCVTNKQYLYLFPFSVCTLVICIIEYKATVLGAKGIYNAWLYNYETVVEFGTHIWLVSRFIFNKKVKKLLSVFVLIYIIIGFYRSINIPNDYTLDNWIYYTGCCILMIFSTYYFFELLLYPTDLSLIKMPSFWFCTGVLLFNSFTFSFFGIIELVATIPNSIYQKIDLAKNIAYLFTYILFCIAFICQIKIKKLLPS